MLPTRPFIRVVRPALCTGAVLACRKGARSMYAIAAETIIAPDSQAAYQSYFAAVAALRAQQPGFHGAIRVDTGPGLHLNLSIWETQAAQQAFQPMLAA